MHLALETYAGARENSMGHRHWRAVAEGAGNLDAVLPGLQAIVDDELRHLGAHWPSDLPAHRSEEHTSELQSLMRISYAVFCLKKKQPKTTHIQNTRPHEPPTRYIITHPHH